VVGRLGGAFGHLAHEVAVEVLLPGQDGAPGRRAAGAVVQGADHRHAVRIGRGLHPVVTGGRAADRHRRRQHGQPAAEVAVRHDLPPVGAHAHLDHRHAVRRHLDVDEVLGHVLEFGVAVLLADAAAPSRARASSTQALALRLS